MTGILQIEKCEILHQAPLPPKRELVTPQLKKTRKPETEQILDRQPPHRPGLLGSLKITDVQARGLTGNHSMHPYCSLRVGEEDFQSYAVRQSSNPSWDQPFLFYVFKDTPQLEVAVWDSIEELFLGHAQVPLQAIVNHAGSHNKQLKMTLKSRGRQGKKDPMVTGTISFKIDFQPLSHEKFDEVPVKRSPVQTQVSDPDAVIGKIKVSGKRRIALSSSKVLEATGLRGVGTADTPVECYCVVRFGEDQVEQTSVSRNSINPHWKQRFTLYFFKFY